MYNSNTESKLLCSFFAIIASLALTDAVMSFNGLLIQAPPNTVLVFFELYKLQHISLIC